MGSIPSHQKPNRNNQCTGRISRQCLISKPSPQASSSASWDKKRLLDFTSDETGTWMDMTDKVRGGASTFSLVEREKTGHFSGKLSPTSNNPYAWAGSTMALASGNTPQDLSAFKGVKVKVKVEKGDVYISLPISDVKNYDFHMFTLKAEVGWQEVEIPFTSFQQYFLNPKIELTGKNIIGITLGASGMQAGEFSFEIEYIDLY